MGFRSTITSSDYSGVWPDWFREKYGKNFMLQPKTTLISSTYEQKTYFGPAVDLPEDVQKALKEIGFWSDTEWRDEHNIKPMDFTLVWLHECGGITKVEIYPDEMFMADAANWELIPRDYGQDGNHNYCYGCSDLAELSERAKA